MQRVQKCIRRKISHANRSKTSVDTVAEQYIELPRALCDTNGVLNKGQKSVATKFYETRYNSEQDIFTSTLPWCPDTVIMEGMFLINTTPLHSHKTMAHYATFLMKRFIINHFRKGVAEVHLLFDNPGEQQTPKKFESMARFPGKK